jgi:hypothetical protein
MFNFMFLGNAEWRKAYAAKADVLCKAGFRQAAFPNSTGTARVLFRLKASKGLENIPYFLCPFSCLSKKPLLVKSSI